MLDEILNQIWDDAHYDRFDEFDTGKQQIKDLIEALVNETFDKDDADAYRFWQKIKAL